MQKEVENMKVKKDNKLKEILVDYVGNKKEPEDDSVTVEMIVEVIADEFPEFLFVVAQENFLRGYEQALDDIRMFDNEKSDQDTQIYKTNTHNNS
tara:strand:+ start:436 stop:720 length:285 start_codon:yes stop_codon:yes gene_type:complete